MDDFSDSSENWLITLDRMMLPSDDSGIGRDIGGPLPDEDGRLVVGVRRRRESSGPCICARIAAAGARCTICMQEVVKNEPVILFPCGHWVQRLCYHSWFARGYQMKCPYNCKKGQPGFRSTELMSAEHDVNEADLTDVEELLEKDRELAKMEDTLNPPTRPPPTAPRASSSHLPPTHSLPHGDGDFSYDGDVEGAHETLRVRRRRQQAKRRERRREMLERGLQELREQATQQEDPQQSEQPDPQRSDRPDQRPPGWFFDEAITDGGDDFGMSDGLTLAQRMYNLPPGRRFL